MTKKAPASSKSAAAQAEILSYRYAVSLHVHERIDPASILSVVRKRTGAGETANDKAKGARRR